MCLPGVSKEAKKLDTSRNWNNSTSRWSLWRRLPEGVDGAALARAAWASGVVLAPGDAFSVSRSCAGFMRFNVAQMQGPESFETLARLLPRA